MLHIKNLTAGYGKVNVLHGISLDVNERECVALIGANGAGKTTTLRCICGLNEVRSGSIEFMGERLDGLSGHAIVLKESPCVLKADKFFQKCRLSKI